MTSGVPRIPEPREWVLEKCCTRCGKPKPWAKFPPRRYWPDGTVRVVAAHCSACDSKMTRARQRKWRAARSEQWLRHEQGRAEWQRRKRRELAAERAAQAGPRLPVEPIRRFLRAQIGSGLTIVDIASVCDLPERAIHRVLYEHEHLVLRVADTIATRLGAHLYDLYPELMEAAA